MSERASRLISRLLAHPSGFLAFNAFTVTWFTVPVVVGWIIGGMTGAFVALVLASYLDVVTWFGGVTQFTLAYQNEKAAEKLDETLAILLERTRAEATNTRALIAHGEALAVTMRELKTLLAERETTRT